MSQLNKIAYLEDEKIKISRGQVKGVIPVHKICAVPSISVNKTGTIWEKNDTVYPWTTWDLGANTVTVDSSSSDDVDKVISIVGLDENYDIQTEAITLNTQTGNVSSLNFSRIHTSYVIGSEVNVGTISVKIGTTDVMVIRPSVGQSLASVYTVPRGYSGYIYQGTCTAQLGGDATGNMMLRSGPNDHFKVAHTFEITGGGFYDYVFSFPPEMPELTDIDVRIVNRSNNARYTAAYDLLLVKNPNIP